MTNDGAAQQDHRTMGLRDNGQQDDDGGCGNSGLRIFAESSNNGSS
jgi:hypothetical protein